MAACVAAAVWCGAAHAGLRPDRSDEAAYRQFGQPFSAGAAGSSNIGRTLYLRRTTASGDESFCTAVNLGNGYALAAGHCVAPYLSAGSGLAVGTGTNFLANPGTIVSVASVVLHP